MIDIAADPIAWLRSRAPWLCAPELGVCIVGSTALAIACRQAGIAAPVPGDLDLSWSPDPAAGRELLERQRAFQAVTEGNVARGTLALRLDGRRIEITTHRGRDHGSLAERIAADLAERDMTIGALAVEVASGRIHDPHGGLEHWREGRIVAVGDAADRVREHPIRWLRYFRKAHELGFEIDRRIRSLPCRPTLLDELPAEAVALELRAILGRCRSPGRCLIELHEAALLERLSPEVARQFDGRPAGPQRWHPEVSQALHLILALEWAAANTGELAERDRMAVMLAVLCHDLGKGYTRPSSLPGHPGHEHEGVRYVTAFLDRWPGLADARARTLAQHVCTLHLVVRGFPELRAGTLARLFDDHFRGKDYPVELFALAVAADSAGRLGMHDSGLLVFRETKQRLDRLRAACATVDAAALRARHGDDLEAFRAALHQERARAIAADHEAITAGADEARP
ncbi:MAG: hypothetical protein KDC98_06620 [Planctomycetes bacterium]|nr:hypothetical protein [Planctomycetota bacterium]